MYAALYDGGEGERVVSSRWPIESRMSLRKMGPVYWKKTLMNVRMRSRLWGRLVD